jgi:hypothetical protein
MMIGHAAASDAAATASGRHWRIAIGSIECEDAGAVLALGTRIAYVGPKGLVEAPVSRLVDAKGKPYLPKSLVWRGGSKALAQWLPAGGLRNVQSEHTADVELKFDAQGATAPLQLEFGDIKAFYLTRKSASGAGGVCESLLAPGQLAAPRAPRPSRAGSPKLRARVYRAAYPCSEQPGTLRTTEADHPPYLPRQLLLLGRGYLPAAREVELPMGRATAQSYAYVGVDELKAVEDAARRAITSDFLQYRSSLVPDPPGARRAKYFAFNWGAQRDRSGNEVYSIGIYELRPC